jgi:adenylyltransferase/sulfurtransferase
MQAAEAIKWLSGIGTPLVDRLLIYHLLDHSSYEIALVKNPSSLNSIPRNKAELENSDYVWACGDTRDITWDAALELLRQYPDGILVDVRESHEQPKIADIPVRSMPLSVIESEKHHLREADLVILFCQSGKRSVQAMRNLQKDFPGKRIHSLAGGIDAADSPINR